MIKNKLLKYFLYSGLSLLTLLHIYKIIFDSLEIDQISIVIFILLFVAIYRENKTIYSISFLSMGILSILAMSELSNLSPVPIFFIALLYCSKPYIILFISVIIPASFVLNYYINGFGTFSQLVEGILFNYAFLTFLYFAVIRQPSDIEHLARITPLSKRQLLILKYLEKGIPRKQIPDVVKDRELWKLDIENFTVDIINSEIATIKKTLDLKTEFQLGVWYDKKTEISRNSSKNCETPTKQKE